jgi:hypothetical protein
MMDTEKRRQTKAKALPPLMKWMNLRALNDT